SSLIRHTYESDRVYGTAKRAGLEQRLGGKVRFVPLASCNKEVIDPYQQQQTVLGEGEKQKHLNQMPEVFLLFLRQSIVYQTGCVQKLFLLPHTPLISASLGAI